MTQENPYAPPDAPIEPCVLDGPLPTSAYVSAGCSSVLVFCGAIFVGGTTIALGAPVLARFTAVSFLIVLFIAIGLALISGWEALRLTEKKRQKQRAEQEALAARHDSQLEK